MNITAQRISQVAHYGPLFHAKELATLWNIQNANTLRMTLKRYTDAGALYRIYRGLYSLLPIDSIPTHTIAAKALHSYCYISTETILFQHGYISQPPQAITLVSNKSIQIHIGNMTIKSRQLDEKYLLQTRGIELTNGVLMATPARAIADMLYFNPQYHFDKPIDWKKVSDIQREMCYPLTPKRYADK